MDLFPPEILDYIFSFLPLMSKIISILVCRRWKDVIKHNHPRIRGVSQTTNKQLLKEGILYYSPFVLEISKFHKTFRDTICEKSAYHGKLEVLKWARYHNCPWDTWTCAKAALGGHLDVLKWLRENGCPWDDWVCSYAARGGHLEVLEWARENKCPWNIYTCAYAAERGHFEVLQFLRRNGCPWDSRTCPSAMEGNHTMLLR